MRWHWPFDYNCWMNHNLNWMLIIVVHIAILQRYLQISVGSPICLSPSPQTLCGEVLPLAPANLETLTCHLLQALTNTKITYTSFRNSIFKFGGLGGLNNGDSYVIHLKETQLLFKCKLLSLIFARETLSVYFI